MALFPLNQDNLSHNQGNNEYEDHFGVHGLMATVLLVHPLVLDSAQNLANKKHYYNV